MDKLKTARQALNLMLSHGHGARASRLVRENCGACALAGYGVRKGAAPNYAGWERVYVQAGVAVSKYLEGCIHHAAAKGDAFGKALAEDIAIYGITVLVIS